VIRQTASFTGHSILQVGGQAILGANDALSTTGQAYLTHNIYYDMSGTPQVLIQVLPTKALFMLRIDGIIGGLALVTTGTPSVSRTCQDRPSAN
jgi:hypothetical protein